MANPMVSSLPAYVDEMREPLIVEAVLGAKSAKLFQLQTGVKKSTALNLLSTNVTFGDGSSCGWDDAGVQEFTQRVINVGNIKVNRSICDRAMLSKWMGHKVEVAAGREKLPFEEELMSGIVADIKNKLECAIYQGDTSSTDDNLKWFDGLIKILRGERVIPVDVIEQPSFLDKVMTVYAAIPEKAYTRGDVAILVGMEVFRKVVTELVKQNLYHYNPGTPEDEIILPGTNVRLIGVNGLINTNKAIASSLKNIVYGTDMEDDEETFDLWFSKDNQEFRVAVYFNAGVQVAFPDEIVVGSLL